MLTVVIAALVLCFIVGAVSSALLVTAFYLYRESQKKSTTAEAAKAAAAEAATKQLREKAGVPVSTSLAAGPCTGGDSVGQLVAAPQRKPPPRRRKPDQEATVGCSIGTGLGPDGSTATSSCSSYNPTQQEQCLRFHTCSADSNAFATTGSYTCHMCGSCCSGDNKQGAPQTQQPSTVSSAELGSACDGEVCIGDAAVSFKCFNTAAGQSHEGGVYFFYRAKTMPQPLPAGHLTVPAVTGTPYHVWFCAAGLEHHSTSIDGVKEKIHCADCRRVLCFELTGDGQVLFHRGRRWRQRAGDRLALPNVRLLALLATEAATETTTMPPAVSGSGGVIFHGDARRLTRLACQAGQLLVLRFGLGLQDCEDCFASPTDASLGGCGGPGPGLDRDEQSAQSAQGDLMSPTAAGQGGQHPWHGRPREPPPPPASQQYCRSQPALAGDSGDVDDAADVSSDNESSSSSATNSPRSDRKTAASPQSMGSSVRKAVRWPITQIESLMESSSSSVASVASFGNGGGGGDDRRHSHSGGTDGDTESCDDEASDGRGGAQKGGIQEEEKECQTAEFEVFILRQLPAANGSAVMNADAAADAVADAVAIQLEGYANDSSAELPKP